MYINQKGIVLFTKIEKKSSVISKGPIIKDEWI